jgi:clan AA aspartic protease
MKGRVTEGLEPVVEIGIRRGDTVTAVPAIIDTGFSGTLCLAERHVDQIDLEFKFVERYELANGEIIVKDVFRGKIVFVGQEQEVDLIFTTSQDTLLGASLLQHSKLIIDYPGCTVQIRQVVKRKRMASQRGKR